MRIQVDDVKLFFDVEGSKLRPEGTAMRQMPTLLLLHGGPGFDHSGFKPAFTEMATVVQLVYLDLRGNGRSDAGPPNKWSLEQWAEDVHSFCEALSIDDQSCWAIHCAVSWRWSMRRVIRTIPPSLFSAVLRLSQLS